MSAKLFFTLFWGVLTLSAVEPLMHSVVAHQWWRVIGGILVIGWTGGNAYLWAKKEES